MARLDFLKDFLGGKKNNGVPVQRRADDLPPVPGILDYPVAESNLNFGATQTAPPPEDAAAAAAVPAETDYFAGNINLPTAEDYRRPSPEGNYAPLAVEDNPYLQDLLAAAAPPPPPPAAAKPKAELPELLPSQATSNEIRDYRVKHPENRDKNYGWKDLLGGAALGLLDGFGRTGNLGGGIVGAVMGASDKNYAENWRDRRRLAPLYERQARELATEKEHSNLADAAQNRQWRNSQIVNAERDDQRSKEEFDRRMGYYESEHKRKTEDGSRRQQTARMNAVAGMFKNLPEYNPADPRFAEITKALGDVSLPITPKDAKKKIDLIQDQRTGDWTTVLTDPVTGKQESRPIIKDGKAFSSTPTVIMQGEYGMLRQNDQQTFTAEENDKKRRHDAKKQQIAFDMDKKLVDYKAALDRENAETDFNRKKQLQDERIRAGRELADIRRKWDVEDNKSLEQILKEP